MTKVSNTKRAILIFRTSITTELEIERIKNRLEQCFGTKVKIHHGVKKGKIEIEYYGNDDLD